VQPNVSTAGCPVVNAPNQPLIGSYLWVPDPNNGTVSYLICYAQINVRTNFWGYNAYSYQNGIYVYHEAEGTRIAIQSIVLPNKTYWSYIYDSTDSSYSGIAYGAITRVGLPDGGSISYVYTPTTPSRDFDCGLLQLTQRTVDSGDGVPKIWKYQYGVTYPGNPADVVTTTVVTDVADGNNDTVVAFAGFGTPVTTTQKCGIKEAHRYVYQGPFTSGTLLRTINTKYQSVAGPYSPSYQVYDTLAILPKEVDTVEYGGQTSTRTYSYDTGFSGALTACNPNCAPYGTPSTISLGRELDATVTDYNGAVLQDKQTHYRWQDSSAYAYYAGNFLNLPASVTVYSGGAEASQVSYRYDESGSPQGAYGHQTSSSRWLNTTGAQVTTSTIFNGQGMPSTTKDSMQNPTTITYQCFGALPYQITNALSQTTTYGYDCNTGLVSNIQDRNDAAAHRTGTTYTYTSMHDLQSVSYPDGGFASADYHGYAIPLNVTTTVTASPEPAIVSNVKYDGLGRPVAATAPSGAITDTAYDGLGRVASGSNPHFSSPSTTDGITRYAYDALGRTILQCQQDNSPSGACLTTNANTSYRQWSYAGNVVTFYDEARNFWQRTSDALGRLTNVMEPGSLQTSYTYNALNNLLSVRQAGISANGEVPRTRSFTYDSLSRLVCASNPENSLNACPSERDVAHAICGDTVRLRSQ
jgi:YD repeat-containing protein